MSAKSNKGGNEKLEHALNYIKKGYRIIPVHCITDEGICSCHKGAECDKAGKHPVMKNWTNSGIIEEAAVKTIWNSNTKYSYKDKSGEKLFIKGNSNYNIGILTGEINDIFVIDVDKKIGIDGEDSLMEMEEELGERLPETVEAITGSGGHHLYYKYHKGYKLKNAVAFMDGLDLRTDGGFVVAEPSESGKGKYYWELEHHPEEVEIAELPRGFLDFIAEKQGKKSVKGKYTNSINKYGEISEGSRDDTLFKRGCSLRARGETEDSITKELFNINNTRCKPPLPEEQVIKIVNSVMNYPVNNVSEDPLLDFPYKNAKGKPMKVYENLDYLLKCEGIEIKYNAVSREIETNRKGTLDDLLVELNTLALINGLNVCVDDMFRFIKKIAKDNYYNPITDYLKKCQKLWDGKSRIKELCNTIVSVTDNKFKEILITKWLLNAVHIAFNEGKNNCEGVLVIQGNQGIGKTRWIRSIVPNPDWLKTGVTVNPSDKDSVAKATKYWFAELGEMDSTLKRDQAELKQFFTENSDEYREPYGRFPNKFPRLTCFYAKVNDCEFLKDTTGNRRYWSIEAISINPDHHIPLDQLWGEVVTLYFSGKIPVWLTEEEKKHLCKSNERFEVKTGVEIKLLDFFDWENTNLKDWRYFTASEIAEYIDEKNPVMVGKAMRKIMLQNDLVKLNTNGRKYLLPPKKYKYSVYTDYKYNNNTVTTVLNTVDS